LISIKHFIANIDIRNFDPLAKNPLVLSAAENGHSVHGEDISAAFKIFSCPELRYGAGYSSSKYTLTCKNILLIIGGSVASVAHW